MFFWHCRRYWPIWDLPNFLSNSNLQITCCLPLFSSIITAFVPGSYFWFTVPLSWHLRTRGTYSRTNCTSSSCRLPTPRRLGFFHTWSVSGNSTPVPSLTPQIRIWRWEHCSFCQRSSWQNEYILLFFCPMHREILNAKAFIEIWDVFRDSVDDMGHLIAYYEFDVLGWLRVTLAANWSPMNKPSLIFMGPKRN